MLKFTLVERLECTAATSVAHPRKHVYFVSYLIMSCTLAVVDAEAVGNRNLSEVPEDRAADVGVDDASTPVDLGSGPRRGPSAGKSSGFKEFDAAALIPPPDAHIKGVFGDPFSMRLIPIHAALLPNGNIYYYGTDDRRGTRARNCCTRFGNLNLVRMQYLLPERTSCYPTALEPTPSAPRRPCYRTAAN